MSLVAGTPDPTVFRFAPNPRILVLDFASLLDQGRMLNRIAALVEKSGLPHDRLLTNFNPDRAGPWEWRYGGDVFITATTMALPHNSGSSHSPIAITSASPAKRIGLAG